MSMTHAVADSATLMRRNFRHTMRYPILMVSSLGVPLVLLLLFLYVLGGTLGAGMGTDQYINYVAPGIILITATSGAASTAITVCTDMTTGIINRFRTMGIARSAVLTAHVVKSFIQTMIGIGIVIGITVAVGFRPSAGLGDWLATVGVLALLAFSLTWLTVAFGLMARSPETANSSTLPFQILPFISSAFVLPQTMPGWVRWLADINPLTPFIDTTRGLLTGTPIGSSALFAVAWGVGITLVSYFWARSLFNKTPTR